MTSNRPSRNAVSPKALTRVSSATPDGASGNGCATTFSSARRAMRSSREILTVFARNAIGARRFIATHSACAAPAPRSLTNRS